MKRSFYIELSSLILVLLAACLLLHHLSLSEWKPMFLYDGDSLTLPLLIKRILEDESFMWVASAQSMIFPEFLIYGLCYMLSPSIEWSLILNAVVNFVFLYLCLRLLASQCEFSQAKQAALALITTLLFSCLILLEDNPETAIATYYLFNTYYSGIILIGLYLLFIFIRLIRTDELIGIQYIWLLGIPLVLVSCSIFSNPMIIVQVILPLIAVAGLFGLLRIVRLSKALGIILGLVIGSLTGLIGRFFAVDYFGQSLAGHVGGHAYAQAIQFLLHCFKAIAGTYPGFILILSLGFCLCAYYSIGFFNCRKTHNQQFFLLCSSFALIQTLCCIAVFMFCGKTVLRYYLPLTIFPLLGFWPLISYIEWPKWLSFLGLLLMTSLGLNSLPHITSLATTDLPELPCVDRALAGMSGEGIADYWVARALNLYGKKNYQLLQTTFMFNISPWQENLARYNNKTVHFIITTDNVQKGWYREGISGDEVKLFIGTVDKQVSCGAITVLFLDEHSPEFQRLNQKIHSSYAKIMSLRQQHKLNEFFGG